MNAILKQRLVGAIVLISLAVIFVPMLFTGKGELGEPKFESNIPPEPAYEIKSPQVSVPLDLPSKRLEKVPLSEPVALEPKEKQPPVAEKPTDDPKTAKQDAVQTKPITQTKPIMLPMPVNNKDKPAQKPEPTEKSQDAPKPAKPVTKDSEPVKQTPVDKPVPADKQKSVKSAISGWVVQVGSFSKKRNATKLRDQLRKEGMASFVVTGKSDKGAVYRVRVGPEINREDAEKLQQKIKQKTKLSGLVMQYP